MKLRTPIPPRKRARVPAVFAATVALMATLALASCDVGPNGQTTDDPGAVTPPCADGDCDPRPIHSVDPISSFQGANSASAEPASAASSVGDVLERGHNLADASPAHIAFRGTTAKGSVRCGWRGIARTPKQRENAIRFWLDLDDDGPHNAWTGRRYPGHVLW